MTEVNIPLLRKAVEWVEEQDKLPVAIRTWEQGRWVSTAADFESAREIVETFYDSTLDTDSVQSRLAHRDHNVCGTAYCVAGKITADALGELVVNPKFSMLEGEYQFQTLYGLGVDPSEYAQKELGLTEPQASKLFAATNTADDIRWLAEEIARTSVKMLLLDDDYKLVLEAQIENPKLHENPPDYDEMISHYQNICLLPKPSELFFSAKMIKADYSDSIYTLYAPAKEV